MDCPGPKEAQVNELTGRVGILDFGDGHATGLVDFFRGAGIEAALANDFKDMIDAEALVMAGAGDVVAVKDALVGRRAHVAIDRRLSGGRSVLALGTAFDACFNELHSSRGHEEGLGQWPGASRPASIPAGAVIRDSAGRSRLWRDVPASFHIHSMERAVTTWEFVAVSAAIQPPLVSWIESPQGRAIVSVENGPLTGLALQPELLGSLGQQLLHNWMSGWAAGVGTKKGAHA